MKELDVAIKAAKDAGKIHLKYFNKKDISVQSKNPKDIVTIADKEAEEGIISIIKRYYPEHNILAEESGLHQTKSEYMWVIDPLDGTSNFYKGSKDFCVLISLAKDQKILFGVTWFPLTKELYVAVAGKGATKNGQPINVSKEADLSKMYANTHMSSNPQTRKLNLMLYEKLLFKIRNVHVFNACIARSLTDVAEGIADFQFREGLHYWDYAAGILLVEEAGGVATDLNGNKVTQNSKSTLISNGANHKGIIDEIKSYRIKEI